MERKARWQEVDTGMVGMAVLAGFVNLEAGEQGEVLLELTATPMMVATGEVKKYVPPKGAPSPRWVKVVSDPETGRLVLFEIGDPTKGGAHG